MCGTFLRKCVKSLSLFLSLSGHSTKYSSLVSLSHTHSLLSTVILYHLHFHRTISSSCPPPFFLSTVVTHPLFSLSPLLHLYSFVCLVSELRLQVEGLSSLSQVTIRNRDSDPHTVDVHVNNPSLLTVFGNRWSCPLLESWSPPSTIPSVVYYITVKGTLPREINHKDWLTPLTDGGWQRWKFRSHCESAVLYQFCYKSILHFAEQ